MSGMEADGCTQASFLEDFGLGSEGAASRLLGTEEEKGKLSQMVSTGRRNDRK